MELPLTAPPRARAAAVIAALQRGDKAAAAAIIEGTPEHLRGLVQDHVRNAAARARAARRKP